MSTTSWLWDINFDLLNCGHVERVVLCGRYVNDLAGINFDPADPGFGHIVIAPHFVEALDWAAASYDSVRGEIRSEWRRCGGCVTLKVTVPANTTADIRIGGEIVATVSGGVHELTF